MLRISLFASSLLVLASCSKLLGINDVTVGDGGTPDAPPNTVIGKSYLRCDQTTGIVDVPTDISATIIQALLPDGSPTGYHVVNGTGRSDGTFTINDVPDGIEYVLKLDRSYFVLTTHVVDVHGEQPARCTPPPAIATTATPVTLNLTGMSAYVNHSNNPTLTNDTIEVDSFLLAYQGQTAASNNQVALNTTYDWKSDGFSYANPAIPLPDATLGDDVVVIHQRAEPFAGTFARKQQVTHLVDTFQATGVTLQNGVAATVTGAFSPATPNQTLTFSINRANFDGGYDGTSVPTDLFVQVFAHPIRNDFGYGATLATFDFQDWSRGSSLTQAVNGYMYADPLPTTWKRYALVEYLRTRYVKLPGTTNPRSIFGFTFRNNEYTGTVTTVPTLLPPSGAKLAGIDLGLGGKVAFDGTAPVTMTWNAVALAKSYVVAISRLVANGASSTSVRTATLYTAGTSLKIPAEVFSGGQFFVFTLSAIQGPLDYSAGQLLSNGTPSQFATFPSGLFRLTANCGDGIVKPGEEECDTSGETATCDVDCTARSCGDGLRNAAAGEACDTIKDTAACDSDCTLPMCGDGHINPVLEDCDDGNATADGNGCSADCRFNNVCGNNVVENKAEACDSGGIDTGACNSDCTLPICGDGHLNVAAGEQCDDGNSDDTDHCNSACQTVP